MRESRPDDQRVSTRAAFRGLFEEVTKLFARHDPMLIVSPQHPDEYELEVGTILPRLPTSKCAADTESIIREEFDRWFYPGCLKKKDIRPLTDDIWHAWLRFNSSSDGRRSNQE